MKNLLFAILFITSALTAQDSTKQDVLTVVGEFNLKATPEIIEVLLDITEKDVNYKECFKKAVDTRKKLKAAFIENGISEESVKTNNFSVREDYLWEKSKRSKVGYQANLSMVIKEKYTPEFADKLLKSFQNYSFDVDYRFRFRLSEDQKDKLRNMAMKGAVKDGKEKARVLADAAGVKLIEICEINYNSSSNGYYSMPILMDEEECDIPPLKGRAYNKGDLEFNPQDLSITKFVTIKWKIKH